MPSWQTIQNSVGDFCVQGFRSRKNTWHGADVVNMLKRYITVQELKPYLQLGRALEHVEFSHKTGLWTLQVSPFARSQGVSQR